MGRPRREGSIEEWYLRHLESMRQYASRHKQEAKEAAERHYYRNKEAINKKRRDMRGFARTFLELPFAHDC